MAFASVDCSAEDCGGLRSFCPARLVRVAAVALACSDATASADTVTGCGRV